MFPTKSIENQVNYLYSFIQLSLLRILITDFFGIMAGSTFSAFYMAEGLSIRGHEVWIAYKKGSFLETLILNSQINGISFDRTGKFNLSTANRLSRFVRDNKIEIVNAQASPDRYITILARWFFKMPGKLIHTRRQKPETTGGKLKAWFYSRGTDAVIAVGSAVKDFLTASGIPARHIKVIPNGIPESKWKNIDSVKVEGLRKKYGIKEGDLVIGCVSRIKKQDQILRAAAFIDRSIKVIFVGIEDQYPQLKKLVKSLPESHQVIFTGEIPNLEALHYYPLFTMKVLPSDMEGFSQSILEAMALGVPVIATSASGNPDLIEHGVNGLLFGDGDVDQLFRSIQKLANEENLRIDIVREAALHVLHKYSMNKVCSLYETFFSQLISE